jgi:hypothetical protein
MSRQRSLSFSLPPLDDSSSTSNGFHHRHKSPSSGDYGTYLPSHPFIQAPPPLPVPTGNSFDHQEFENAVNGSLTVAGGEEVEEYRSNKGVKRQRSQSMANIFYQPTPIKTDLASNIGDFEPSPSEVAPVPPDTPAGPAKFIQNTYAVRYLILKLMI